MNNNSPGLTLAWLNCQYRTGCVVSTLRNVELHFFPSHCVLGIGPASFKQCRSKTAVIGFASSWPPYGLLCVRFVARCYYRRCDAADRFTDPAFGQNPFVLEVCCVALPIVCCRGLGWSCALEENKRMLGNGLLAQGHSCK